MSPETRETAAHGSGIIHAVTGEVAGAQERHNDARHIMAERMVASATSIVSSGGQTERLEWR